MSKAAVLLGDMGSDHEGFPPTPVIAGSPDVLIDGKPVARVGDPLAPHSKPKHSSHPRVIADGSGTVMINGIPAAVTGSAISCGGVTIGSGSVVIGDTHTPATFSGVSPTTLSEGGTFAAAQASALQNRIAPAKAASPHASPQQSPVSVQSVPPVEGISGNLAQKPDQLLSEPGFHIVRQPMSKLGLLTLLYGDASAKPDNFERLNPGLGSRVLPGEMIVIADPNSLECTVEENDLMQVAEQVNQEVRQLSEPEAQFIVDHYNLLEMMTSSTATGLGVGATMIGQQIKSINATLKELEVLHQDTFRKHGTLSHSEFFERRQRLFTKLDFALGKVARKGMSLDDNAKLKRALGLSSKSIVHEWKASGVGGIPGYGTHYATLANAAKYAQGVGYVALGLDYLAMDRRLEQVCTFGSQEQCEVAKYQEYGRFSGSALGGALGSTAALGCGLLGVASAGIGGVACVIIVGGIGSAVGGQLGGTAGGNAGNLMRKVVTDGE
ncbi:type VI secretion system PAAR protein [Marinobacter sp. 1_MG-2023]|uniref:type VI secretion system PAAR protein n=1 Tax=Marinobacter sp. 1_MG-2023 TaxID=3062627 RepID=UPI0026E3CD42|nr:type VI secretion system PAAR protein [Marinobacter sp. 1_MG-2023]MDO6822837.1 type VI secretion system PAAR protein [Marinobacter sp. 1_MG-2023]